jgi:hypothetical protein
MGVHGVDIAECALLEGILSNALGAQNLHGPVHRPGGDHRPIGNVALMEHPLCHGKLAAGLSNGVELGGVTLRQQAGAIDLGGGFGKAHMHRGIRRDRLAANQCDAALGALNQCFDAALGGANHGRADIIGKHHHHRQLEYVARINGAAGARPAVQLR